MHGRKIIVSTGNGKDKCEACNWESFSFYRFEGENEESSMCGLCFLDMLITNDMEVFSKDQSRVWR